MRFFFAFTWLLFPYPGNKADEQFFSWEALVFIAIFYLLIRLNISFISPGIFMKQANFHIKKIRSRKEQKQKSNEMEESRILIAQMIFYETAMLSLTNSGVNKSKPTVHYNLARAYSLSNKHENALFHLHKAIEGGYTSLAKAKRDPDLASLKLSQELQKPEKIGRTPQPKCKAVNP